MTSALLVTGGDVPPRAVVARRLAEFAFVCAADSGLDVLRGWGIVPDLVVGDFDSIADPGVLVEYASVLRHPADKDETDTEIGVRELRGRGYDRVVLAGGGGGRIDHLLAIRSLLERPDGPDEWLTARERIVRIGGPASFEVGTGAVVSVFPLAGGASGMSSEGLAWPLDGLSWDAGGFGVSNRATGGTVRVDPGRRPLLVVLPLEGMG